MLIVLTSTSVAIVMVVIIHYEVLTHLSEIHFKRPWSKRILLPVGVLGVILTHVFEVWVFAMTYYFVLTFDGVGGIAGNFNDELLDYAYFSFVTYTSLGYGDLVPEGYVRFIAGAESLVGLVLIAWSASFTYLEMQRITERSRH